MLYHRLAIYFLKVEYIIQVMNSTVKDTWGVQGRIQDFKLGEAHLKNLLRAEGSAKYFGEFRMKNHDFTPKNHILSILEGGGAPGVGSSLNLSPIKAPIQYKHKPLNIYW